MLLNLPLQHRIAVNTIFFTDTVSEAQSVGLVQKFVDLAGDAGLGIELLVGYQLHFNRLAYRLLPKTRTELNPTLLQPQVTEVTAKILRLLHVLVERIRKETAHVRLPKQLIMVSHIVQIRYVIVLVALPGHFVYNLVG